MPGRPLHHAVIAGGSIAGLLATCVLSRHFDHVTLIERDALARSSEPRRGVPQGQHAQALLPRGQMILEHLFPGIQDELCGAGAVTVSRKDDFAWHHTGGWRFRFENGASILSLSRPLLEATIAKRVRALPNVTILENARSEGFRSQDTCSISGIWVRITRPSERFEEIPADLVVDATGRGSATPDRLTQMGCERPKVQWLRARVTYASCRFRQPAHWAKQRILLVTGAPAKRTGFLLSIEGGQWLVSLGSFFDEPAPRDHEEFLASARSMAVPDLYNAIRDCEPLSDVVRYHFPGSLRRRYEALERPPEGLIVLGDAVCSFNPVYGQGITISAMQAEVLDRVVARAKHDGGMNADFARRWFRSIGPDVNAAWNGISIEDLQFPELAHERPLSLRPLQWYMKRVHRATYRSQPVTDQFYQVVGFLAPPSTLFRPRIMADVLFGRTTSGRHSQAEA